MRRRTFLQLPFLAVPYLVPSLAEAETKTLEQLIHRHYGKDEKLAERNNQYLIDGIRHSPKAITAARASKPARVALENALGKLSQCPLQREYSIYDVSGFSLHHSPHKVVKELSIRQLVRAYLLLDSLKEGAFRSQVMGEIRKDLEDPQTKEGYFASEYGGLIKIDAGHLALYPVASVDATSKPVSYDSHGNSWTIPKIGTNSKYVMPEGTTTREPHIFEYHFHAVKSNETGTCGPSIGVDDNGHMIADIGNLMCTMNSQGEGHELVMTKLKGDRFNVVYYSGEKSESGPHRIIILNMGNWNAK